MKTLLVLSSLLLIAPAAVATDAVDASAARCFGTPCDEINLVCEIATGRGCVRGADATAQCFGTPCDEINLVCKTAFGNHCLGRAEASAREPYCVDQEPYSEYCGNLLAFLDGTCTTATGHGCWDRSTDASDVAVSWNCITVEPWYGYCTAVGRAVDTACKAALGRSCVE